MDIVEIDREWLDREEQRAVLAESVTLPIADFRGLITAARRGLPSDTAGTAAFLEEAARYFETRPTNGEDKAHWANVYNAENCRKAADRVSELEGALRDLVEDLEDRAKWMDFKPSEDGKAVPCGNGVYIRARRAIGKEG